jgi:hypothetical protein
MEKKFKFERKAKKVMTHCCCCCYGQQLNSHMKYQLSFGVYKQPFLGSHSKKAFIG